MLLDKTALLKGGGGEGEGKEEGGKEEGGKEEGKEGQWGHKKTFPRPGFQALSKSFSCKWETLLHQASPATFLPKHGEEGTERSQAALGDKTVGEGSWFWSADSGLGAVTAAAGLL